MTKKENLFLLIKSLSKAEKRYFKIFSGHNSRNANYLKLFSEIEKQNKYDEKEIKNIFKDELFINQLHVTKIYLTELILKSLRNFHSRHSINSKLLSLLSNIEILFDKELYDLCYYKLEKAETIALTYEKLPLLLEVFYWKQKLYRVKEGSFSKTVIGIIAKEKEVIEKIDILNSYWKLASSIINYASDDKSIRNNPLVKNEKLAATLRSKVLYYHIIYTLHVIKGNNAAAKESISSLISLIENYPDRIQDDPASYATAISNKISLLLVNKEWEEIPALIKKVREIPSRYKLSTESKFTVRLWIRLFNIELEMYRDKKELERGIVLIREIIEFIQERIKFIPDDYLLLFYYQFAYIYFLRKDYARALHWLNEIVNKNYGRVREDIQSYARILGLIIHFELNNIIVLRYAVSSCRRFLKKKRNLQEFETLILNLFSKLSLARKDEYPKLFNQFFGKLFGENNIVSNNVLDYIDFKSWFESRVSGKYQAGG